MFDRLKKFWHDHDEAIVTGAISAGATAVTVGVVTTLRISKMTRIVKMETFCDMPDGVEHTHGPQTIIATLANGSTVGGPMTYDAADEFHKVYLPEAQMTVASTQTPLAPAAE